MLLSTLPRLKIARKRCPNKQGKNIKKKSKCRKTIKILAPHVI
jgi:hypothetical protein